MSQYAAKTSLRRRLLFVSHSADRAGAERGLLELVRGLRTRGHDVSVMLPQDGPLCESLRDAGVEPLLVTYPRWARDRWGPVRSLRYGMRQLAAAHRLRKEIARIEPDVVITNTIVIPAAAVAARRLRLPHIWYLREFGAKDHGLKFDFGLARSIRMIDRLSALVIVNCTALQDYFSTWIPRERLKVVYNAVELDVGEEQLEAWRRERAPSSRLRCVLLGNIRPPKGQEEAIRAIGHLAERGVEVDLALVGMGNRFEVEELRALARTLGVEDRVEFVGFSNEPLKYLCQSDVALVCSTFEAFGRVTVEALKCGCPVIATDRGGVVEHIRPGENGFVYPSGDPVALADHIEKLVADPERLARMARGTSRWANEHYNSKRQVDQVEAALEMAVKSST